MNLQTMMNLFTIRKNRSRLFPKTETVSTIIVHMDHGVYRSQLENECDLKVCGSYLYISKNNLYVLHTWEQKKILIEKYIYFNKPI